MKEQEAIAKRTKFSYEVHRRKTGYILCNEVDVILRKTHTDMDFNKCRKIH